MDPVEEFLSSTQFLLGKELEERKPWNHIASADAIRHFALGTSDANPLWTDVNYAARTSRGRLTAPPLFLASIRYPVLHGAATSVAMESWISDVRFSWDRSICLDDKLVGISKLLSASAAGENRKRVRLRTKTEYREASKGRVAEAEVTLVRMLRTEHELRVNRGCHRYAAREVHDFTEAMNQESIRGDRPFELYELQVGSPLPSIVRGPLSVADMVSWNAGVGPATAGGAIGMRALWTSAAKPLVHPLTGAPVSASHQHEDPLLSAGRGMSLPFDNGIMRLAWMMPLVTNWIGDEAAIQSVHARILRPNLYGDVTWYSGHISASEETSAGFRLQIDTRGANQLGERTVEATFEVRIPQVAILRKSGGTIGGSCRRPTDSAELSNFGSGELSLFEMLDRHAQNTPDSIALADESVRLTYRQLVERVNSTSARIRAATRSHADELRVAIFLPRSAEAVVAQLAVVRAGGAYVPVDVDSPREFLRAGLNVAGVNHVFVTSNARLEVPSGPWTELALPTDSESDEIHEIPPVDENRLALVMFTSGSSSGPRGVEISRRSLWRYLAALGEAFGEPDEPRIYAHTASLAFSASTRQCYLPLWLGQSLHVASLSIRRDPLRVLRWLNAISATNWDTTPSVMSAALSALDQLPPEQTPELSALRQIKLTGELLEWKLTNSWKQRFGNQQEIFNLYSQTETAGTVAVFRLPLAPQSDQGTVPIGSPIRGVTLDIVDEQFELQKAGATGQLRVTSRQLARGYAGNDRDNSRFHDYNECGTPASYLTGDMAIATGDGTIRIVGRADRRVKIRGFRIGLEDVERALRLNQHVADAAVTVDDSRSHPRLVAAYVAKAGAIIAPSELRAFLKRTLPDYMLPSNLLPVVTIPKTPSGKIAYHELPGVLSGSEHFSAGELRPEHQKMAKIWRQVLVRPVVA
ncbi:MAG: AMP-binding protein, partial [Pirellulales bacterium]